MEVVYEDNHIIVVNKAPGEIVQGDKTGDTPLSETIKAYLKEKYNKPGNVFCGVVHRIDRPVGGLVIFAKTSKALTRLNEMLRKGDIHKTYWALVEGRPDKEEATLTDYLVSDGRLNKTFIAPPPEAKQSAKAEAKEPAKSKAEESAKSKADAKQSAKLKPEAKASAKFKAKESDKSEAKKSVLKYKTIANGDRYTLLEINLLTGRKHQIRCQLSATGHPIKGDLKYGAKRSNRNGGISLLARRIEFIHPVSKELIQLEAPIPEEMQKLL